jgi:hypothetical protein
MGGHFVDGCVRVQVATPVQVVAEESGSRIDTMLMKVAKRLCVAHPLRPRALLVMLQRTPPRWELMSAAPLTRVCSA